MRSSGTRPVAAGLAALALALATAATAGAQTLKYPLGAVGKYTPEGMLVQGVNPGSPLDKVGLQKGDVILKVDGRLITNQDDLAGIINSSGGSVVLVVRKGTTGRTVRVTADLADRGKGIWAPYFLGVIGQFTKDGLLIATAIPDTPAAALGLGKGDLIARINNEPVRTQEEFYAVLNASGGQATLVVRSGKTGRVGTLDVIVRIDNLPIRDQDEFKTVVNNSGGTVTLAVRKAGSGRPVLLQVDLMNNPLGAWCEPDREGMRVTAVARDSSAGRIGLERGDVILKIDDERIRSQQDLLAALYNSGGFITMAVRKGSTGRVVKLEADLAR